MTPIDYIANGIKEGNWQYVCEGYLLLTGNKLQPPLDTSVAQQTLQQITNIILNMPVNAIANMQADSVINPQPQIINIAQQTITEDGEDLTIEIDETKMTPTKKEVGTTQLITNEPLPSEIEANKRKAKIARENKIKLERKPCKQYNVSCNECGQAFMSDRPDGQIGQKCNKCLQNKKRSR